MYWISTKELEIGGYRMLKQRTWVIMVRPCVASGTTTVAISDMLGKVTVPGISGEQTLKPWKEAVPSPDGVPISGGCWTEWHRTRSYINLIREVRKLLKTISRNDVLVMEVIDVDTMITPRS